MAQRLQPRSLGDATSIRLSLPILFLLSTLSSSLVLPRASRSIKPHATLSTSNPPSRFGHALSSNLVTDNLSDINVTAECQPIFVGTVWPVYFGGGKMPALNELQYRVFLKTYATHNDTLEVLKTPLLKNIVPSTIYDHPAHKGFVIKISPQEVCDIYKLPIVHPVKDSPKKV
jgi:hypothetical protein